MTPSHSDRGNDSDKVQFWYSEGISRVRATADPGGDAFTVERAKELREELTEAIKAADADRGDEA